jgi:hypothetical protein
MILSPSQHEAFYTIACTEQWARKKHPHSMMGKASIFSVGSDGGDVTMRTLWTKVARLGKTDGAERCRAGREEEQDSGQQMQ